MDVVPGKFHKNCRLKTCTKSFTSASRNTAYCSDECAAVAKKKGNVKVKRRRGYAKDAVNRRAQSASRKQAREDHIAETCFSCCQRCGTVLLVKFIEVHHRDGNPFNNHPDNKASLCKRCHAQSDTEWRKCKELGIPIPDVRLYVMVHQSTGSNVVMASRTQVRDIPIV